MITVRYAAFAEINAWRGRGIPAWARVIGSALAVAVMLVAGDARANPPEQAPAVESWSVHFQATTISQKHGAFTAPYAGDNSLATTEPWRTTETATLFLALRLWRGAELYGDPEASGGKGLSGAVGAAGFPNGEATRVGASELTPYLARLFLRQTFALGGATESAGAEDHQLAGTRATSNVTVTVGKFAAGDIFDDNRFSHDARTQFENWSLMANGAWDFPADTRGYTFGGAVEWNEPGWALRAGLLGEPKEANGPRFDPAIARAFGTVVEGEKNYDVGGRKGTVRLLGFVNRAHMGSYREALDSPAPAPDVQRSRSYRSKYGCGVNFEQEITDDLGVFGRGGWNDGRTETWAFTEIDNTLSLGASMKGTSWQRKDDVCGVAGVSNGLARDHREYLAAGGYGFIIGDGRLAYAREQILETYYSASLGRGLFLSVDGQWVVHPAYNRDRGPVFVGGFRVHAHY